MTDISAERIEMTAHNISGPKFAFFGMPMWMEDGIHSDMVFMKYGPEEHCKST